METFAHQELKRLAVAFLRRSGCLAIATEVRCPISRYAIDVAGYADRPPPAPPPPPACDAGSLWSSAARNGEWAERSREKLAPRTILIECKQSRSDFLRDSEHLEALLRLRSELDGIRGSIEEHRIKLSEPQLRRSGTSLFAELEEWDFSASRLPAYRRILRELRRLDEKVHGQTKFFLIGRYCLADELYIAAPRGMIRRGELPPGWGLLECQPRCLAARALKRAAAERAQMRFDEPPGLTVRVSGAPRPAKPVYRLRLLRNIAVAATRAAEARGAFDGRCDKPNLSDAAI